MLRSCWLKVPVGVGEACTAAVDEAAAAGVAWIARRNTV